MPTIQAEVVLRETVGHGSIIYRLVYSGNPFPPGCSACDQAPTLGRSVFYRWTCSADRRRSRRLGLYSPEPGIDTS
jgi:hypothetical protein